MVQAVQLLVVAQEVILCFLVGLSLQLLMVVVLAQVVIVGRQGVTAALEAVALGIQVLQLMALQHKAIQAV